jgi:hypothetical protein
MATGIINKTYDGSEAVITTLYASASAGISGYVIPIAWIVLAINPAPQPSPLKGARGRGNNINVPPLAQGGVRNV